ncbi:SRPBCC family protein [Pseudomonas fluorescens]|uniref:SRPBCC family protein n=1 Tax=Pseudomonas fluorescens TaxID=294 RepID=UPI003F953649
MINVSRRLKVNAAAENVRVSLTRDQVWQGLVSKARNAVPYVAAITECNVIEDKGTIFIREVILNGERVQELVTLTKEKQIEFVRLSGNARGIIKNVIEEDEGELYLRFTFDFSLKGVPAGSEEEVTFSNNMEISYLSAVKSTLQAIREKISEAA